MFSFLRKLNWLTKRRDKEAELQAELQFHLDEEAEEQQAKGLPDDQAKWAARRDLGNLAGVQEDTRAAWGWKLAEQFAHDLRYAFRTMVANRSFTALAVVSLALGIGASTAIYSLMESILLRSLPVQDPESLVVLSWRTQKNFDWNTSVVHSISGNIWDEPESGSTGVIVPYPAFQLFEKYDTLFSSVFTFRGAGPLNVSVKGQAEMARGQYVSGAYFHGLGLPPAAGRLLIPDDDRAGAPPVAVVSHALSEQRFGGAQNAAGQSILVNNVAFTVVGVAPPEFFGTNPGDSADVFLPLHTTMLLNSESAAIFNDPNYYWLLTMARLRPGVSRAQAQAALAEPFHQWVDSTATEKERAALPSLVVEEGGRGLDVLRRRFSQPLYILLTLVGCILVIACANISNLLLSRATARRREMAVRLSVGAGRMRVIRQLLTESVVLATLGGAAGILLAVWGVRFLTLLLADGEQGITVDAQLNWNVLAVALGLTLLTGVLFGLAPAIQSTKVDVIPALKEVRAGERRSRWPWLNLSHGLVVSQIVLSLLMLVAAGLFVRTLSNLHSVELGFDSENLLLFELNARQAGHTDAEIASFYADLQDRFRAIPGARSVSLSHQSLILAGYGMPIAVAGKKVSIGTRLLNVGPEYFSTMQIALREGRPIEARDTAKAPLIAVVSESFARKNFGDESPIGRTLVAGGDKKRNFEIVGVAKEARYGGIKRDVPPVVYFAVNQVEPDRVEEMTYVVRTAGDPLGYVSAVRDIVHRADSRVPVSGIITQSAQLEQTISQEIAFAKLCTAFAVLALLIAGVGLYGTVSYKVARRTGEIGIRMALGAQRASVYRIVMGEVFVLTVIALAIGIPAAWSASSLVKSFLFKMEPTDSAAFLAAVVTLLSAALLAAFLPARKASRIDPVVALRHE